MSPLFEDSGNDLPLPARRAVAESASARRTPEIDETHPPEREVTLNTGIVLGLFFALALLCAVFFGFGYSMGRKSVPPAAIAEGDNTTTADIASSSNAPKPSPGSAASTPVPGYVGPAGSTAADSKPMPGRAAAAAENADASPIVIPPAPRTRTSEEIPSGTQAPAPIVRVAPAPSTVAASATAPATAGATYVQVAAVSHQEDADVLLSALRRRGYTVLTRPDPNDHLIHVQLGPFPTKKDADAMRQRLAGDGYNAILK